MATQILVNIGSGNGLLPDGTEPLPSMDQWSLSKGNFTRDTPAINRENHIQFA